MAKGKGKVKEYLKENWQDLALYACGIAAGTGLGMILKEHEVCGSWTNTKEAVHHVKRFFTGPDGKYTVHSGVAVTTERIAEYIQEQKIPEGTNVNFMLLVPKKDQ